MRRSLVSLLMLSSLASDAAFAQSSSGGWVKAQNSRVRLSWCDGPNPGANSGAVSLAYVEMRLDPGWKTYWRNPGDAGVAPMATWETSENVSAASFNFPAPQRFTDAAGETIGYKDKLVLPVRIQSKDASKPVIVRASLSYGVCSNICVPVDVELTGACHADALNDDVVAAVEAVPRGPGQRRSSDPALIAVTGSAVGVPPQLTVDVDFGAGATSTDMFVEAPDGFFAPQAKPVVPDAKGRARYVIDMTKTPDAKDLVGKQLRFTMISSKGTSEAVWAVK